jgi:uncharacterized protein (DUF2147 family)
VACTSAAGAGIEGRWTTFDEQSNRERAIVEIGGDGHAFTGRIVALTVAPGEDRNPRCTACPGDRRDQPILGLPILHVTITGDGRTYTGHILDPDEGLQYRCIVTPGPDGRELSIRGYVGIPALGRTVTWRRAP